VSRKSTQLGDHIVNIAFIVLLAFFVQILFLDSSSDSHSLSVSTLLNFVQFAKTAVTTNYFRQPCALTTTSNKPSTKVPDI
jgi:hypothetical protein